MRLERHRLGLIVLFMVLGTGEEARPIPPSQEPVPLLFRLEILVVDQAGRPLDGVEGTIRGGARRLTAHGGLEGRLRFDLPNGRYDLFLSRPDFYETVIRGLEIDVPTDPEERLEDVGPLRVLLHRRLTFEKDLEIIGPAYIQPPPIDLAIRPDPPARAYGEPTVVVTLSNSGPSPLPIPLNSDFDWSPELLVMRILVQTSEADLYFDEPFGCLPDRDCRMLAPGESVEVPIELYSRSGYAVGRRDKAVWPSIPKADLQAGAYWILPRTSEEDQPVYTRTVEVTIPIRFEP